MEKETMRPFQWLESVHEQATKPFIPRVIFVTYILFEGRAKQLQYTSRAHRQQWAKVSLNSRILTCQAHRIQRVKSVAEAAVYAHTSQLRTV